MIFEKWFLVFWSLVFGMFLKAESEKLKTNQSE